jgi:hypothetical protein
MEGVGDEPEGSVQPASVHQPPGNKTRGNPDRTQSLWCFVCRLLKVSVLARGWAAQPKSPSITQTRGQGRKKVHPPGSRPVAMANGRAKSAGTLFFDSVLLSKGGVLSSPVSGLVAPGRALATDATPLDPGRFSASSDCPIVCPWRPDARKPTSLGTSPPCLPCTTPSANGRKHQNPPSGSGTAAEGRQEKSPVHACPCRAAVLAGCYCAHTDPNQTETQKKDTTTSIPLPAKQGQGKAAAGRAWCCIADATRVACLPRLHLHRQRPCCGTADGDDQSRRLAGR